MLFALLTFFFAVLFSVFALHSLDFFRRDRKVGSSDTRFGELSSLFSLPRNGLGTYHHNCPRDCRYRIVPEPTWEPDIFSTLPSGRVCLRRLLRVNRGRLTGTVAVITIPSSSSAPSPSVLSRLGCPIGSSVLYLFLLLAG